MALTPEYDEKYTYADYLKWDDDQMWEIIEGVPYNMTPAPGLEHQSISMKLSAKIFNFLEGHPFEVFAAPFDVRLDEKSSGSDDEIQTVVQPDISIICDNNKLDKRGCNGTPDIIVEILSPSTSYKDETEKLKLYEKYGVKEYWIVNPDAQYIMIYHHKNNKYGKPDYLIKEDALVSKVIKGLKIELSDIFSK